MPVKKDQSGRRSVEAEVEVPGTPEEVWQAIATGPGISSWFVPTTIEERVGGITTTNFGPGMESAATIQAWDPPRQFIAEMKGGPGVVATEWIVEARGGGSCIVRVVHSWFASTDDWDNQFEGHTHGWRAFFRILRLYLTHFSGQPCSALQFIAMAPAPKSTAWAALTDGLGYSGAKLEEHRKEAEGAPPMSGIVESVGVEDYPELLVRLGKPTPGIAHLFPMPMGGQVLLSIRLYLYGEQAALKVAEVEQDWTRWLAQRFPAQDGK